METMISYSNKQVPWKSIGHFLDTLVLSRPPALGCYCSCMSPCHQCHKSSQPLWLQREHQDQHTYCPLWKHMPYCCCDFLFICLLHHNLILLILNDNKKFSNQHIIENILAMCNYLRDLFLGQLKWLFRTYCYGCI